MCNITDYCILPFYNSREIYAILPLINKLSRDDVADFNQSIIFGRTLIMEMNVIGRYSTINAHTKKHKHVNIKLMYWVTLLTLYKPAIRNYMLGKLLPTSKNVLYWCIMNSGRVSDQIGDQTLLKMVFLENPYDRIKQKAKELYHDTYVTIERIDKIIADTNVELMKMHEWYNPGKPYVRDKYQLYELYSPIQDAIDHDIGIPLHDTFAVILALRIQHKIWFQYERINWTTPINHNYEWHLITIIRQIFPYDDYYENIYIDNRFSELSKHQ